MANQKAAIDWLTLEALNKQYYSHPENGTEGDKYNFMARCEISVRSRHPVSSICKRMPAGLQYEKAACDIEAPAMSFLLFMPVVITLVCVY